MRIPRIRLAPAVLLAAALFAGAISLPRDPDLVWCPVEEGGGVFRFLDAPGGDEFPHGATMSAPDASWAYYYSPPSTLREALPACVRLGADTVSFVATGREERRASTRWIEMRRCDDAELEAAIAGRGVRRP